MAKCLMLDVDGVLVDGRPEDGKRWNFRLHEDLGVSPEALGREFFAREWQDVVVGKQELFLALAASLERIPASVKAEELIDYWFRMDSRIVEAVLSDCRTLRSKGIPIFLATNQEHERAKYLMDMMGLNSEVEGIVYSAQVGFQKPQPDFYAYAESVAGFKPDELLLVDDTQANIDGAREAGWDAIHWDGSKSLSTLFWICA